MGGDTDVVIRCDPIDGQWQAIGSGRYRGIVPEGIEATSNGWGPDQLGFNLKAVDPAALRPDVLPFSPVELEVGGLLVWAGRVKARSSSESGHDVQCEGMQYHLDDDVFERAWVHTRLADYRDQRSFLTADLATYRAFGQVATDDGVVTLMIPAGTALVTNDRVGVVLDFGPDSTAKRAVVTWDSSNNSADVSLYCRGANQEALFGTGEDFFSFACNTGASGTSSGTVGTARRYVGFALRYTGAGTTTASDIYVRIKTAQMFRATAYESGNASILKADSIWTDALAFATLLNQETTYVAAGTFSIPEARTSEYQSPREVIEAANAYENYLVKIGGEALRSLVARAKPTVPRYEVGAWAGARFTDSSATGEDVYTDAVVTGTGPDGAPLIVKAAQKTSTLASRNGVKRTKVLPIRSPGSSAVYTRFGDLWLSEHAKAAFAGKLEIDGDALRRFIGGSRVPAHSLLLAAGEKINFAHRIDPDTGAVGRVGTIAAVKYSHDSRTVEIDIDDRRDHFETILSRYGILVDQFA